MNLASSPLCRSLDGPAAGVVRSTADIWCISLELAPDLSLSLCTVLGVGVGVGVRVGKGVGEGVEVEKGQE